MRAAPVTSRRRVTSAGSSPGENPDGFSLLEAVISVAILAVLVASGFTITFESMSLLGDTESDHVAQTAGDRALARIVDILHRSGRVKEGRAAYPRVLDGGSVLEFRLPDDLDGDGLAVDRESAAIEWSPHVFSIKRDASGVLSVCRSGAEVYTIAHHVRFLRFETAREDPSLHLKEISIDLEIQKNRRTGHDAVFSLSGSAQMRN